MQILLFYIVQLALFCTSKISRIKTNHPKSLFSVISKVSMKYVLCETGKAVEVYHSV